MESVSCLRAVLRDVETETSLGLHPWEQHPQRLTRLVVNVDMYALLADGLRGETEAALIDYDMVRAALRTWPGRPHTMLIETLLEELVDLCFRNKRVSACRVSIMKPDIFNEAAGAGVEVFMRREDHCRHG